jgi:hypothetical protein
MMCIAYRDKEKVVRIVFVRFSSRFSPRAQFAIKPDWERIWFSEFQPSAATKKNLEMLKAWFSLT